MAEVFGIAIVVLIVICVVAVVLVGLGILVFLIGGTSVAAIMGVKKK